MMGSKPEGRKLVMGASGSPIWGFLFGESVWETCQRKWVLWWALLGCIPSMYAKKCVGLYVCVSVSSVCLCVCVYVCVCVCVYQQVQSGSLRHEWLVDEEKDKQAVWVQEQQGLSPSGMCQIYRTFLSHGNMIHTPWEVLSNSPWYLVEGAQVGFEGILSSCYKLLLSLYLVCSDFLDVSSENLEKEEWRGF